MTAQPARTLRPCRAVHGAGSPRLTAHRSRLTAMPHWIKLRSGLLDHLPGMSDAACKLFTWLCLQAPIRGPQAGVVETNVRSVADGCGWGRTKSSETLAELETAGYIAVERPRNPAGKSAISIRKFIQADEADASATADTPEADASALADTRVRTSGRVRTANQEESTTSEHLRYREEDKREENSPLPPSLDESGEPELGEEIDFETLWEAYPAHDFGKSQARIEFQNQFGRDDAFLDNLPQVLAACRRAIEICPADRRGFLPSLARVLSGDWHDLEARARHQAADQPGRRRQSAEVHELSLDERRRCLEEIRNS